MTAKMFGYFSASSTARRLLSIDVPMVMMRVTPASVARREHVVEVGREIRVIEVGVRLDQHCRLKIADFRLAASSICNLQFLTIRSPCSPR